MFDHNIKTYAVLEFTTIDGYYSSIELTKKSNELKPIDERAPF